MIIVSDDFSGLTEAIKEIFPSSDIQLCYVHLKLNIRRNMAKEDSKTMISELNKLKYENDYDVAVERFEKMCKVYEKKYPYFIKRLLKNSRYYFQFLKYPEEVRKHIYTTNIVESFNSMIEVLRINNGGFFGSRKSVEVSIYLIRDKLQSKQWKKGMVHIKGAHYEIQQMFNLKFNSIQTQNS